MEMAHGLTATEKADGRQPSNKNSNRRKSRIFHVGSEWLTRDPETAWLRPLNNKPPCVNPVACLGPLGWTCIGPPDGRVQSGTRTHHPNTVYFVEPEVGFLEIESYDTDLCDQIVCTELGNVALEKVTSSLRYNMRDRVLPCGGKNRGLSYPTIGKWQNPVFSAPREIWRRRSLLKRSIRRLFRR